MSWIAWSAGPPSLRGQVMPVWPIFMFRAGWGANPPRPLPGAGVACCACAHASGRNGAADIPSAAARVKLRRVTPVLMLFLPRILSLCTHLALHRLQHCSCEYMILGAPGVQIGYFMNLPSILST